MSPPSDGARPVAVAVLGANGCQRNVFWVVEDHFGGIIDNGIQNTTEYANEYRIYADREYSGAAPHSLMPIYTAADYDALRAEVDELTEAACRTIDDLCATTARAEAAEAKVEDFIEAAEHYFSSGTAAALRAVLDAALNEGGE